jgi:SSS family solute:Na+ symporter
VLAPLILVLPGVIAFHLYADQGIAPDQAYGTLVQNVLPESLVGFFAAVLFGAILSSFNSALNSTATLISLGIVKHLQPQMDDHRMIGVGKLLGGLVALVAMVVAPLLQGQLSIFDYLQTMNALYFIPIFSVVLVGLLTRRVPAMAAKAALVVGLAAIALGYFVFQVGTPQFPMHKYHFLGVVFAGLVLLMLVIGWWRPRSQPWRPTRSGLVDMTPWRWARPMGIGLLAVVLLIYIWFADPSVL